MAILNIDVSACRTRSQLAAALKVPPAALNLVTLTSKPCRHGESPSRTRPLPRRPRLPLLRRHRLPGPARCGNRSHRATCVVSLQVAGGQVRRDCPPVWSGRGVVGRVGHVCVCRRLVGGAPAGHGGSRCGAARSFSGRPSVEMSPLLARPRCRSAGVVRRGREHAARTAGRTRPRGRADVR